MSVKPKRSVRDKSGILQSFSFALEGIVHTLRHERNMRIHFLFGFLVLIFGVYVKLSAMEFMLLSLTVSFVLVAEMVNTAVEYGVDLIEENYHPLAKIIKDISAAAVFVSSVNAAVVGYLLMIKQVDWDGGPLLVMKVKHAPAHLTLMTLILVVGFVLFIKVIRREKALLRGGMPSGHSAVAFAVWTSVSLITANLLVAVLVLMLAVMIARSRVAVGIHSSWEVTAGAMVGSLITLLVFQLLP